MTAIASPFTVYTDFVGEINIPNLTAGTDIGDGNIEELERLIAKYEKKLLVDLLGTELYDIFIADITSETPEAKWTNFYLLLIENKLIANYVYFYWQRNNVSQTGPVGEQIAQSENSTVTSAGFKMSRAWNEMSEYLTEVVEFLQENEADYQCETVYGCDFAEFLKDYGTVNTWNI